VTAEPRIKVVLRWLLTVVMVTVGGWHFVAPGDFVAIMPPWLPWHLELVLVSGAAEIAGGLGLAHPRTRRAAGIGLIALYVAVFPANVHMAVHQLSPPGTTVPAAALWARLPLQLVLVAWAWWVSGARGTSP
jgi:uncharacterized membrane protein